eukprot:554804_1
MDTLEDAKLIGDTYTNGYEQHVKADIDNGIEMKEVEQIKTQNTSEEIHLHFDALQIERYIRLFFSFVFVVGSLGIYWQLRENNFRSPYHNIAYCMTLVQSLWLVQFLGVVLTIQHLHSVVVLRKVVPDTVFLVVPYAVKEYKTIIMSSISAMSSMRGSNLFYMLGSSSNICFGMTFSAASFKWLESLEYSKTDDDYVVDTLSLLLLLLSTYGSTIITGWELDLNSKLSSSLHSFGAFVTFVAAPFAFGMNQKWSNFSIGIMIWTYVCLAVFGSVYAFVNPEYKDNPRMVHKVSMFCIFVELVAVVNGMLCVILYIWCMEGDVIL